MNPTTGLALAGAALTIAFASPASAAPGRNAGSTSPRVLDNVPGLAGLRGPDYSRGWDGDKDTGNGKGNNGNGKGNDGDHDPNGHGWGWWKHHHPHPVSP